MCKPNIFDYATSELSQDAVLAYMLAWAHPDHKETTKLHKLGQDFLLALLDKTGRKVKKIKEVIVKTQDNKIDVSVDINKEIFMIIEDKVGTTRHGDQILRYKEAAAERFKREEKNRKIVAVYLKTGNESKCFHPEPERASCFFRDDLLKVLGDNQDTDNTTIEEFRIHLQRLEDDTQSYKKTKPSMWSWAACEGFFSNLEKDMRKKWPDAKNVGWYYVPIGDFLGFWWSPETEGREPNSEYQTYLQIEAYPAPESETGSCVRLCIRVSSNTDEKITWEIRNALWDEIMSVVAGWPDINDENVIWSGRAGRSSNVAQICFDKDDKKEGGYLVKGTDGNLDFGETMRRTERAIELLNSISPQK